MLHVRGVMQGLVISLTGVVITRGPLRLFRPVGRMGDGVRVQTTSVLGRHSIVEASSDVNTSWFASSSSVNETSAAVSDASIGLVMVLALLVVGHDSVEIDIRETPSRILEVISSTRWLGASFEKREGNLPGFIPLASIQVISPSSVDTNLLRCGVNICNPCSCSKGLIDAMPNKLEATQLATLSSRDFESRIKRRNIGKMCFFVTLCFPCNYS